MAIKGWKNAHGDMMRARSGQGLASKRFVVRRLNKDGSPSKMPPSQYDYCDTREQADKRAADLAGMNPGTKWTIEDRGAQS